MARYAWPALVAALLLTTAAAGAAEDVPPGELVVHPALIDDVLFSPEMGVYMSWPPLDLPADHWMPAISDIAYYRVDWSRLNPEEGVYAFDDYFEPLWERWVRGESKRLAFRVMCESMHSNTKYVTPKWVFDRGVPGVSHVGLYDKAAEQIDPVFWDDRYLDIQCEFIRKLGEYLDGRPGLEFVDIGSIGEWGEMHLGLHIPNRWTPEQLEETGFTRTRYVEAYRRVIDAHVDAFPTTPVFLNVGGPEYLTIMDYAASRGVHFRQDGLTPSGASHDVGEWLYKPYARQGILCNFEFHSSARGMAEKGWDLRETIDKGLEAPISYLHANLGTWRTDQPGVLRAELTRAARKVGYRFVVTEVRTRLQFGLTDDRGGRLPVAAVWRNVGVAPTRRSMAVDWFLLDGAGRTVAAVRAYPVEPTNRWWPGEDHEVHALLHVPPGTPRGALRLKAALVIPETEQRVLLGIEGRDAEDRYDLCEVRAVEGQGGPQTVYEQSFEEGDGGWYAVAGMALSVDRAEAHSGDASLLIEGTQERGWNYAGLGRAGPARPWARYELTAWLKVDGLEPGAHAPYVKIGVRDADGQWLENHTSGKYDVRRIGTWQRLQVVAEVPPTAAELGLAVEKGAHDVPVRARMWLDDVTLVMTDAP